MFLNDKPSFFTQVPGQKNALQDGGWAAALCVTRVTNKLCCYSDTEIEGCLLSQHNMEKDDEYTYFSQPLYFSQDNVFWVYVDTYGFSSGADKLRPRHQIWPPQVFLQPGFYIFKWLKSIQMKNDVPGHKVLLEHSRTHYLHAFYGCSHAAVAEFNHCRRD